MAPLCILHAGTEKTGSTSLQAFLRLNEAALGCQKIWVPRALVVNPAASDFNAIMLSTASQVAAGGPDNLQRMLGLGDMAAVARHRAEVAQALAAELASLPFVPEKILISGEHVHSRLRDVRDVAQARALLAPFCSGFEVVVYLRRQDALARSAASMAVKNGAAACRLIPQFDPSHDGRDAVLSLDRHYFDYAAFLQRLEAVFGAAALRPRLYAPEGPEGPENFDVVTDFFGAIGVDIAGMPRPPRRNSGFSAAAVDLLLYLNPLLKGHPQRDAVRRHVIPYLPQFLPGDLPPAPAAQASAFLAQFAAGNELIRRRWFPARAEIFAAVAADVARPPHVPLSEAQAAAILAEILSQPALEGPL